MATPTYNTTLAHESSRMSSTHVQLSPNLLRSTVLTLTWRERERDGEEREQRERRQKKREVERERERHRERGREGGERGRESDKYEQKAREGERARKVRREGEGGRERERAQEREKALNPLVRRFLSHGAMSIRHGMLAPTVSTQTQWAPSCQRAALWSYLAEEEDQIVDVPVPQIMEDAAEIIPKEHISERNFVEAFDVPAPQIQEEIVKVSQLPPQERTSERTVKQIMDVSVLVPQIQEQLPEVAKVIPQRRIPKRIVEHTRDVPVPQILEQFVEVAKIVPQEHISERTAEQTVAVPTPQILEEIVEAVSAPHERVQQRTVEHVERISEQIVDAPVPHGTVSATLSAVAVRNGRKTVRRRSRTTATSSEIMPKPILSFVRS